MLDPKEEADEFDRCWKSMGEPNVSGTAYDIGRECFRRGLERGLEIESFWIQSAKLLHPQPGDTLIFRHPRVLSDTAIERIKKCFSESFPGITIFVLEECADMEVQKKGTL